MNDVTMIRIIKLIEMTNGPLSVGIYLLMKTLTKASQPFNSPLFYRLPGIHQEMDQCALSICERVLMNLGNVINMRICGDKCIEL